MKWKGTEYTNTELMARIDADVQRMLEMSKKANYQSAQGSSTQIHDKPSTERTATKSKPAQNNRSKHHHNIRHSPNCPNRRSVNVKSSSGAAPPNGRRSASPSANRRDQHRHNKADEHSCKTDKAQQKPLSISDDSGSKDILNLDNILANIDSIINKLLSSLGIDKDIALILLILLLLYHNEADITLIFAMLYLIF